MISKYANTYPTIGEDKEELEQAKKELPDPHQQRGVEHFAKRKGDPDGGRKEQLKYMLKKQNILDNYDWIDYTPPQYQERRFKYDVNPSRVGGALGGGLVGGGYLGYQAGGKPRHAIAGAISGAGLAMSGRPTEWKEKDISRQIYKKERLVDNPDYSFDDAPIHRHAPGVVGGSVLGGTIGREMSDDDDNKNRNTALGALGGAGLGYGVSRLGDEWGKALWKESSQDNEEESSQDNKEEFNDPQISPVGHAALAGAGASVLPLAHRRTMGLKKIHHGHDSSLQESILQEGILANDQNNFTMTSEVRDRDEAVGHAYVTPSKGLASTFGDTTTSGNVDFETYDDAFEADPEFRDTHVANIQKVLGLDDDGDGWWSTIKEKTKPLRGYVTKGRTAARTEQDIPSSRLFKSPDYQWGNELKRRIKKLPSYATEYPGRFASGVGLGVAGLGAMGYGGAQLYDSYNDEEEDTTKEATLSRADRIKAVAGLNGLQEARNRSKQEGALAQTGRLAGAYLGSEHIGPAISNHMGWGGNDDTMVYDQLLRGWSALAGSELGGMLGSSFISYEHEREDDESSFEENG